MMWRKLGLAVGEMMERVQPRAMMKEIRKRVKLWRAVMGLRMWGLRREEGRGIRERRNPVLKGREYRVHLEQTHAPPAVVWVGDGDGDGNGKSIGLWTRKVCGGGFGKGLIFQVLTGRLVSCFDGEEI
ncbi:hypothetical protein OIU76_004816 [Salix suchowensis]|nr:hypothetical protein OIU76_004816 [Salix suchowensis]